MGVYYFCPSCNNTLHLTPQSRGFGQMKVACFVCGKEARYSPSGPPPNARIVDAPETGRPASSAVPAIPHGMQVGHADMPNPTVPMQTPDALLALDARETASTIPVQGLSDADIARMLGHGHHSAEPESDATIRSDAPDFLARVPLGGYGAAGQPPQRDQVPLDPWARAQAEPASSSSDKTRRPGPRAAQPDVEEEIPTRAVAGLADRDIMAYASGLYHGLPSEAGQAQAPTPRMPPGDSGLRSGPAATAHFDDSGPVPVPPTPVHAARPATQPEVAPTPAPAPRPTPAPAPTHAPPHHPHAPAPPGARNEPELSNSMFNQLGVGDEPAFGDGRAQPRGGLGADRFTGEHPAVRAPAARSGGAVWIIAAIVMIVLAVGIVVGGLYIYKSRRDAKATPAPEKAVDDEGSAGGSEGSDDGDKP